MRCPICEKELTPTDAIDLLPFCSVRCRQVDLLRWTQGKYAIAEPLDSAAPHIDPESLDPDGAD